MATRLSMFLPDRRNPVRWFAWYPVKLQGGGFRWLVPVTWYVEETYNADNEGTYAVRRNRYLGVARDDKVPHTDAYTAQQPAMARWLPPGGTSSGKSNSVPV